jgi:hypothetical protein
MPQRIIRRLLLAAVAGVLTLALVPAHADDVAVAIATPEGATLFAAPDGVPVDRTVTGTADFTSADGTVLIEVWHAPVFGGVDPNHPENAVDDITNAEEVRGYSGQARCELDANNHCNWSWTIPLSFAPGNDYRVVATASQPNGDFEPITATDEVVINVL